MKLKFKKKKKNKYKSVFMGLKCLFRFILDLITSQYHERCINKLRGLTVAPAQLRSLVTDGMAVLCKVKGNPLPPDVAVSWKVMNGTVDEELVSFDQIVSMID